MKATISLSLSKTRITLFSYCFFTDFKIPLKDIMVLKEIGAHKDIIRLELYYIQNKEQRLLKLESLHLQAISSEATCFHILMNDIIQGK